ncbi:MAG: ATP-binding protein [Trichloromonas sp.]|nr:ATP-binding protein [Trichloromonas sp.]
MSRNPEPWRLLLAFLLGALVVSGVFHLAEVRNAGGDVHLLPLALGGVLGVIGVLVGRCFGRREVFSRQEGLTRIMLIVLSTLGGALLLVSLSALQKAMAGFPFHPKGFVVPFVFGSGSGVLLGLYLQKIKTSLREQTRSRSRLSLILRSLHDGVIVTDPSGRIELMNPAARDLLPGIDTLAPEETLDSALSKLVCSLDKSRQSVPSSGCPGLLATRQGGKVLRCKLAELHDPEGADTGSVLVLQDVTFEHKIKRLKSEFIIAAAHELKTPITVLSGFAEMLQDELLSPEQRQDGLRRIYENSWRLNHILDVLLDISCVDSGLPLPLERRIYPVAELLDEVRKYCRGLSTNQRFDFAVSDLDRRLDVDRIKVEQIFTSLVSNAVKFSPNPGVIRIAGRPEAGFYHFEVVDQGTGMNDEERCRAFDRFFRADASNTALGGIGLGMSLVKAIVEAHGGRVSLESQPGLGTRVAFSLPLAQV